MPAQRVLLIAGLGLTLAIPGLGQETPAVEATAPIAESTITTSRGPSEYRDWLGKGWEQACRERLKALGRERSEPFRLQLLDDSGPANAAGAHPWLARDFRAEPIPYLLDLLAYATRDTVAIDWRVEALGEQGRRPVTRWYHAPWLEPGDNGRECLRGLTRERHSRPHELHELQDDRFQNWGIAFYNALGARTLTGIWSGDVPNLPTPPERVRFAEGTVAVKLLFTEATPAQVPYLEDSVEWPAMIYRYAENDPRGRLAGASDQRQIATLRLLQIDIAARDDRSPTDWVFGTFVYHAEHGGGSDPWQRLLPIGIIFGNDPQLLGSGSGDGAGGRLEETMINPAFGAHTEFRRPDGRSRFLGWEGRLNGPVDNPVSSCLSCHGSATFPRQRSMTPTLQPWFRNLSGKSAEAALRAPVWLDYSLQLALGLENFCLQLEAGGIQAKNGEDGRSEALVLLEDEQLARARAVCKPWQDQREDSEVPRLRSAVAGTSRELSPEEDAAALSLTPEGSAIVLLPILALAALAILLATVAGNDYLTARDARRRRPMD